MNAFIEKRTEVMQTLISMIEPTEIQIHTVSHSEGMETVNAARGKYTFL